MEARRPWQDTLEERVQAMLTVTSHHISLDDAAPFDMDAAIALYQKAQPPREGVSHHTWKEDRWRLDWISREKISREEATWWFFVGTDPERLKTPRDEAFLRHEWEEFVFDVDTATGRMKNFVDGFRERYGKTTALYTQAYLGPLLEALLPIDEAIRVLYETTPRANLIGFLNRMSQRTEDAEAEARLGEYLRKKLSKGFSIWDSELRKSTLALVVRAHDPQLSKKCIDTVLSTSVDKPLDSAQCASILSSLADPEVMNHYIRRAKPKWTPALTRLWFARNGLQHLDIVERGILGLEDEDLMNAALEVLEGIEEPELARVMLPITGGKVVPRRAFDWFMTCDREGLDYLVEESRARGKRADRAHKVMMWITENGGREELDAILEEAPESVRQRAEMLLLTKHGAELEDADESTLPDWLLALKRKRKPKGWSRDMSISSLSGLQIAGREEGVSVPLLHGVLQELKNQDPEEDLSPALVKAREFFDPQSQDRFLISLLDEWVFTGESNRHIWCLHATRVFGGERTIQEVSRRCEAWYGERRYKLSERALHILGQAGADGLVELQRLSQRAKYKRLREKATFEIRRLASRRKWTMDEFEDRFIPTGGLDEGDVIFDYGDRRFALEITPEGVLRLREEGTDELHKSLPRKRKSDDVALVAQARSDWKSRKKQIGDIIKVQLGRMRTALSNARRYMPEAWSVLLEHPLMKHLLCGLLWGVYDEESELVFSFRVDMDQSIANEHDEAITLPDDVHRIGLVHPIELDAPTLAKWSQVFAEYEIVQPFPQLQRRVFELERDEVNLQSYERFCGVEVEDSGWLRGHLRRNHWVNASTYNSGLVCELRRNFPHHGVTAHIDLSPGFDPLTSKFDPPQTIQRIYFRQKESSASGVEKTLRLSKVPAHVLSEALFDLVPFVKDV